MNLTGSRIGLERLCKELLRNWAETKTVWRDAKAAEFERRYLQELAAQVDKTGVAIEKLDNLLAKVRTECE